MSYKIDYYNEEYVPYIVRWGKILNIGSAILSCLPALVVSLIFKIKAPIGPLMTALIMQWSGTVVYYFVDPVAYYPILGLGGTYLGFVTGNMSLSIATNASKAAGVDHNTQKGQILTTIGIATSVLVKILMLTVALFIGASILSSLSQEARYSLRFLTPAVTGAGFINITFSNMKSGIIAIFIAIIMTILLKLGFLDIFPSHPSYVVAIVTVFGSAFVSKKLYERNLL